MPLWAVRRRGPTFTQTIGSQMAVGLSALRADRLSLNAVRGFSANGNLSFNDVINGGDTEL
jgi:hypothetical protein